MLVGENYLDSYMYIPILLYGNLWNILLGLLGGVYIAYKLTREIAMTTLVSATMNIVIKIVMSPSIGIWAACLSTLISYVVMGVYRLRDIHRFIDIKFDKRKIMILHMLFCTSAMVYFIENKALLITNTILAIFVLVTINKQKVVFAVRYVLKKEL